MRATRAEAAKRFAAGLPDDYTDMSWPVRCVVRTDVPPYLPTIYNNNFQIFQSPGYVTIAPEMIHSARIIPMDGRPHLHKNLRQWLGDTRGRWEGATLVVETTNFRPTKACCSRTPIRRRSRSPSASRASRQTRSTTSSPSRIRRRGRGRGRR